MKNAGRVGLVDADDRFLGQRKAHRLQHGKGRRTVPGGIDHQVGRKLPAAAALLFKSHAGHRRPVRRGQQLADAAAVAQGNVCAGPQPPPDGVFDGGSRQGVVDQAEIALGKGVITRPLGAKVDICPDQDGARFDKVALKAGKQRAERAFSADQQPVGMPGLRRARPVRRTIGKRVAFEHDDLFKMIRQCPGCRQPGDPGANDDRPACHCFASHRIPHPLSAVRPCDTTKLARVRAPPDGRSASRAPGGSGASCGARRPVFVPHSAT